ncbi:MAG: hypothetical protein WAX85_03410 [Minisyncoccia bacterium]
MTQVVPAIIPHTKEQLEEEINKIAHFTKLIQIDVSDGIFTREKTWPYNGRDVEYFDSLTKETVGWPKWEDIEYEVHLMVENPESVVLDWVHTGVQSIVAQIEATDNFQKVIDICKENSVAVGLAIKPATDISRLEPFVTQVDFIQVMGSDLLGKHDVSLEDRAVKMIKRLREKYPERIIGIDIGVNEDTAEMLVEAGANRLISGGAILKSDNPEEVYRYFESLG